MLSVVAGYSVIFWARTTQWKPTAMAARQERENQVVTMFTVPRQVLPSLGDDTDSGPEPGSDQEVDEEESEDSMTCGIHSSLALEMYCSQHDEVLCKACAAQGHR